MKCSITTCIISFFIVFSAKGQEICDHPDFERLMEFYESTNGENWTINQGWEEAVSGMNCDPCDWFGIQCDGNGRVNSLKLRNNNLVGTLPIGWQGFNNLIALDLSNNGLTGELPSEFYSSEIFSINVSNNELSGEIPYIFGINEWIYELDLSNNNFSGCIDLYLLNLCKNQGVDISGNALLQEDNWQQVCTDSIGVCELPCDDYEFSTLLDFYNKAGGDEWIDNSGWKEGILGGDCDYCDWYGITCNQGRVSSIELKGNNLNGTISNRLATLHSMIKLDLSNNQLNGSLKEWWNILGELYEIDLSFNQFSGQIPNALIRAGIINLSHNQFSGPLRQSFSQTNVNNINLSYNNLTGEVPINLTGIYELEKIDLRHNDFEGCIPIEYLNFCDFFKVRTSDNPKMPWYGSLEQYCYEVNGNVYVQFGAQCNDGNDENGSLDIIDDDCNCVPKATYVSDLNANFKVIPNPTFDMIYLEDLASTIKKYQVYNATGMLVKYGPITEKAISLVELPRGIYFVSFMDDQGLSIDIERICKM